MGTQTTGTSAPLGTTPGNQNPSNTTPPPGQPPQAPKGAIWSSLKLLWGAAVSILVVIDTLKSIGVGTLEVQKLQSLFFSWPTSYICTGILFTFFCYVVIKAALPQNVATGDELRCNIIRVCLCLALGVASVWLLCLVYDTASSGILIGLLIYALCAWAVFCAGIGASYNGRCTTFEQDVAYMLHGGKDILTRIGFIILALILLFAMIFFGLLGKLDREAELKAQQGLATSISESATPPAQS